MKKKNIKEISLPRSLRKHIRQRKALLRHMYGTDSTHYKEFLVWVQEKRQEKEARYISGHSINLE